MNTVAGKRVCRLRRELAAGMVGSVPDGVPAQLSQMLEVIERHLAPILLRIGPATNAMSF